MTENSTRPIVSVVIPHYGGYDILSECLISLKNSTYPNLEIIVVDNNSYDGNIHNFIEKIYKKALPNLTKEKLQKLKGKFALSSKPGQILSMGIDQKKMRLEFYGMIKN